MSDTNGQQPEIRLRLNAKVPTMSREDLTQAVHALREYLVQLTGDVSEISTSLDTRIQSSVDRKFGERGERLEQMTQDCVDLLQVNLKAGLLNQEQVNQSIGWRRHSTRLLRLGHLIVAWVAPKKDPSSAYTGSAPDLGPYEADA